jgi:glycogen operon protein
MPLSIRVDWEDDRPPNHPWNEMVIYEIHTKGFTKLHPVVRRTFGERAPARGRAALEYLTSLGVTAVELLPVHHIIDRAFARSRSDELPGLLVDRFRAARAVCGNRDSWRQVREFMMVKAHRVGIEVSSTSSTTTPPKGTISGRCCRSRVDNPRITG